jgi:Uma2 family endonuclease
VTIPAPDQPLSLSEYLALERHTATKHELVDGQVYAMAGASFVHNVIVGNVVAALRTALGQRPCYTLPSDMKVLTAASRVYYPDVSVTCDPPRFHDAAEDVLLNPNVVVEVLSDSTERLDRGEKLAAYTAIPSVSDYILIASKRVRVEHFARTRDFQPVVLSTSDRIVLAAPAIELSVEELYARVF